ncbi:putative type I secretion protein [Edwardsiella piscicida]|uniref:ABC Transporter n=6 Tax=Edwardsiella TaxID=635 RepID=A0A0H3DQU6_EDWTF|nr:ATP-binding cassette domain-containing protein [Edwardsiella piscicida]ACY83169.1 putative type I secretion protein [Edwardsiella tarda EIB202]ADM40402.1 ABC Transporter [Edwardsiella tarda FL6-60]ARD18010.1 type I secretion protein [Edwardsiella piscicida]ELM3736821.1 ATP-binding cassette domain-containing protein [Edwardsiella piscicida]MDM3864931.1 ATP-binding cassette domain-containing protein [Edwardsiella piscicida]
MKNNFFDIMRKYCFIEGERFNTKNKSTEMQDVIININEYIVNYFFEFTVTSVSYQNNMSLPKTFVVEWGESNYIILQRESNRLINLTSSITIANDDLINKRVFFLSKELKKIDDNDAFSAIKKMTPRASYFSLGLIFFALITPLYSNLFNTRLIYSDSYNSIFFVTGVFILFVILELLLKSIVYAKTAQQVKTNNITCNAFYLYLLKLSNCRNAAVKIRTIDSSATALWESYPLIPVDFSLALLFLVCLFSMMSIYAFPLFIYYIILTFLCVYVRFSAYKKTLQTNTSSYEKMSTLISLEEKRKELKFLRGNFCEKLLMDKTTKDEYTKMEMNIDNHHWAELIKSNSFVSMVVMFICSYFAVVNGALTTASIIAIMIINSRLSGALVGGINKMYLSKLHAFHIKSSLGELLKDRDQCISHNGIAISHIENFSVSHLTIPFLDSALVNGLSLSAVPGDIIGITGASGTGKSSLIKALSNSFNDYSGTIKLNNVDIKNVSADYINNCISYHSTNSRFIKGTLRENFMVYGIVNDQDIIDILSLCCKKLTLSRENIDEKYVDELNLSNGERQKVLLCMALFKKPEVIFLDESTSFLSSADAITFLEEIKSCYAHAIVFFATHDIALKNMFTQIVTLPYGEVMSHNDSVINIPMLKIKR